MEYVVYAGVLVLLLGAVALIAWGTRHGGGRARVQAALEHLDSYDDASFQASGTRGAGESATT